MVYGILLLLIVLAMSIAGLYIGVGHTGKSSRKEERKAAALNAKNGANVDTNGMMSSFCNTCSIQ